MHIKRKIHEKEKLILLLSFARMSSYFTMLLGFIIILYLAARWLF